MKEIINFKAQLVGASVTNEVLTIGFIDTDGLFLQFQRDMSLQTQKEIFFECYEIVEMENEIIEVRLLSRDLLVIQLIYGQNEPLSISVDMRGATFNCSYEKLIQDFRLVFGGCENKLVIEN